MEITKDIKLVKTNISVWLVLGKFPPRKIAHSPYPNSHTNRKPNPQDDRGQFCSGAIFPTPVWLSTNYLLSEILLYLQNLDKIDKKLVKKREAMTTVYTNNYHFPQEYIGSMSAKQQIRELRKHS